MKKHGNNNLYTIKYLFSVIKDDIKKLSSSNRKIIKDAIEKKLTLDPIGFGKPLRYSLKGHRRLRIGSYRVVYKINPENTTVIIIAIKHRKDIYKDLSFE